MNHPRRLRSHRLLLLCVPLALLPLFVVYVQSKVPRPKTVSDAWFWDRAESTTGILIEVDSSLPSPTFPELKNFAPLYVKDRSGIRDLLKAFEGTSDFTLVRTSPWNPPPLLTIYLEPTGECVYLHKGKTYFLYRANHLPVGGSIFPPPPPIVIHRADTNPRSAARFLQVLRAADAKRKAHQKGYTTSA